MDTNSATPPTDSSRKHTAESFAATAIGMLETALALHGANRPIACEEINVAVAEICGDGKARGVQVERLIMELKRAWYSVPEPAEHNKGEVVSRLVTLCIAEFYRSDSGKSGGR